MQRKRGDEQCERLRNLDSDPFALPAPQPEKVRTLSTASPSPTASTLRQQCAEFVLEHQHTIATARPEIPESLNDRAADIWEPLLAIADIAGGDWPEKARAAAVTLTTGAQENSPSATLLFDIGIIFVLLDKQRLFSSVLANSLNHPRFAHRPWMEARKGKPVNELWLAQQLRPYGVRPRNLRIEGDQGKGYELSDLQETFTRYVPQSELDQFKADLLSREHCQTQSTQAS
jgi:hypothetical protein